MTCRQSIDQTFMALAVLLLLRAGSALLYRGPYGAAGGGRKVRRMAGRDVGYTASATPHPNPLPEGKREQGAPREDQRGRLASPTCGNRKLTRKPPPSRLASSTRPPCASAISRASARPRPVPERLVE